MQEEIIKKVTALKAELAEFENEESQDSSFFLSERIEEWLSVMKHSREKQFII